MRGWGLFLGWVLAAASTTAAGAVQEDIRPELVDVTLYDTRGNPVTNVARDGFEVFENGEARNVLGVTGPADERWQILFLFDRALLLRRTDSLLRDGWNPVARALADFLPTLAPRDRIMVALFEEGVEVLLPWSEVGALAPEEIGAIDPEVRRTSASGKDLYGALRQGVDTLADVGDRGAIVVLTDGGDRRLSPLWITDGDSEVLDPLFGLPDAAEAREFEETSALLASSGVRFFALAVGTGRTPSYDALAVSDLFPGADAFGAAYLDRVRARLEEWARVSHGQVYYRETLGDATGLYPAWLRRLAFRRRYTIRFAASVGQTGPTPEVRHPDPALRIEPIPTVDGAGSVR